MGVGRKERERLLLALWRYLAQYVRENDHGPTLNESANHLYISTAFAGKLLDVLEAREVIERKYLGDRPLHRVLRVLQEPPVE